MNSAHWHLLLTHFPIAGVIISLLLLITGLLIKQNPAVMRVALGVLIFTSLASIPAFLTGEGAEDVAEKLPGVTHALVEEHEEAAETFYFTLLGAGGLALITLFASFKKQSITNGLYILVTIITFVTIILAKNAGTSGGEIRHTEIRANTISDAAPANISDENEEDDN